MFLLIGVRLKCVERSMVICRSDLSRPPSDVARSRSGNLEHPISRIMLGNMPTVGVFKAFYIRASAYLSKNSAFNHDNLISHRLAFSLR